jgi:hypothetical protein
LNSTAIQLDRFQVFFAAIPGTNRNGGSCLTDLTPLLRVRSLVNLGLNETEATRLTGIEQLRAAGVHVNGLAGRTRLVPHPGTHGVAVVTWSFPCRPACRCPGMIRPDHAAPPHW